MDHAGSQQPFSLLRLLQFSTSKLQFDLRNEKLRRLEANGKGIFGKIRD